MAVDTMQKQPLKGDKTSSRSLNQKAASPGCFPQGLLLTSELRARSCPASLLWPLWMQMLQPSASHIFVFLSLIGQDARRGFFNLLRRYCQRWLFHPHLYFLMGTLLFPWAPCPIPGPVCQKITTSKLRRHAASSAPARRTGSESLEQGQESACVTGSLSNCDVPWGWRAQV